MIDLVIKANKKYYSVSLSKYMDSIVNTFNRLFIINIRFSLIISVTIRFTIF